MIVRFSQEAQDNLEQIADDIAEFDPLASVKIVERLRGAALGLADFPRRFPAVENAPQDLRKQIVKNYLIFYRVQDKSVDIVRIVHAKTD